MENPLPFEDLAAEEQWAIEQRRKEFGQPTDEQDYALMHELGICDSTCDYCNNPKVQSRQRPLSNHTPW